MVIMRSRRLTMLRSSNSSNNSNSNNNNSPCKTLIKVYWMICNPKWLVKSSWTIMDKIHNSLMQPKEAVHRFSNHKMHKEVKCQEQATIGSFLKCMDGTQQTSKLRMSNVGRCPTMGSHQVQGWKTTYSSSKMSQMMSKAILTWVHFSWVHPKVMLWQDWVRMRQLPRESYRDRSQ